MNQTQYEIPETSPSSHHAFEEIHKNKVQYIIFDFWEILPSRLLKLMRAN